MLDIILSVLKKTGQLAISKQNYIKAVPKVDKTPVTEVDLEISTIVRNAIKPFIENPDHMFVDEEFSQSSEEQWSSFKNATYSWFIDPISGTLVYLNGLPFYGISIGVLKNGKPHVGGVYLPALDELYWHENGRAYFTYKDNTPSEIEINDKPLSPFSLFFINLHQRFTLSEQVSKTTSFMAIQPGLLWSATGKFSGALSKLKVWDMAAAWGVCQAAGLNFYGLEDGKKIEHVSENDFDDNWKMRQPMIMATKRNIDVLRKNIKSVI